jgi:hypothetical protein
LLAHTTLAVFFCTMGQAQTVVNTYCVGCHNEKLKSGGFSWSSLDPAHPDKNIDEAEKVIRKVRAGLMPPPGAPRPASAVMKAFAGQMEFALDQSAATHPNPGRPALHRLNRTEYANVVRDLLGVDTDVTTLLPTDDMSHGFDNMADVLTISPALMQGYIRAAGKISREAVGDASALPLTSTYSIPRTTAQTRHVPGTPFGTRGGMSIMHNFPADGQYSFKIGLYYAATGALFGMNQGKGQQIEISVNGERVALLDINPNMKLATDGIKTPAIYVRAGPQRISATFPIAADGPLEDEYRMVEQSLVDVSVGTVPGMTTLPHLHELSITGPVAASGVSQTPSRRRIFTCRPLDNDEVHCAKQILGRLARQAYRRPVTDSDVEGLLGFYQRGRNKGDFEAGIRTGIQAILASPEFVLRFERTPAGVAPGQNYRISDMEMASRLAFFLWSSSPDEELLRSAEQDKLRDPAVLENQVRRMLKDSRAQAMTANFASEWLRLQNLKGISPDLFEYPDFDQTLAVSMRRETELLFENMMRQDHSVTELLTANYTFVNERLAKHYGIPNIMGSRFRRVELNDPNRFGLLGQASILTLTSTAIRTSPVQRGKYVMEVLLGTPPPPPPPNIPALPENAQSRTAHSAKLKSVRERMEEHRANPVCAACHKMMDPIGFALENYNVVGVWRNNDSGFQIDPKGQMFDGTKLDGPASLRQALMGHSDVVLSTFTENLLAYGMGRVLDPHDMTAVRTILRDAGRNENRFSSFVLGVVKSQPFQMRRAEEQVAASASAGN